MKYVINNCFGGFSVDPDWLEENNISCSPYDSKLRTNPLVIEAVENDLPIAGSHAGLEVVDVPDNATDWEVIEYDGMETMLVVIDGIIRHM